MPSGSGTTRRGGGPSPSLPARSRSPLRGIGASSPPGRRGPAGGAEPEDRVGAIRGTMREAVTSGGVRVLSESIPGVRSVSVGAWVRQGSAHEEPDLSGASHLLEHLVFKGTRTRTAHDIAIALEKLGGSLDAFTSREHTSYQARVLSEHLPEAMDVLSDIVREPLLRAEDLDLEREVVLEEIATVEDIPDDLVFELHGAKLWGRHPYGRSILGTEDSVSGIEVDALRKLHLDRYLKGELIVAAAGHLAHDDVLAMVEERFGDLGGGRASPVPEPPETGGRGETLVERALSQSHIVIGNRTPPRADPRRYPLVLISAALGGGMSSRLFQRIREELALAYSVYSYQAFHSRAGSTGVYLGTRPATARLAVEALKEEYAKLAREGLSDDELRRVKDQVKGQVMLSLESTSSRLFRLAGFALYDQPYLTLDELLDAIERVDGKEVAEVTARYFQPEDQVVLRLGPNES